MSANEVSQKDGQRLVGWRVGATTIAIGMTNILLVNTHHVLAVRLPDYLCLQPLKTLLPWSRTRAAYSNMLIGEISSRQIGSAPEEPKWSVSVGGHTAQEYGTTILDW